MEYTALRDNSVVKLPGPASIGKANGKTVARLGFVSPSLKRVIPKIISKAIKKSIKAPATANSLTLIPIRLKILSPKKRKIIITTAAMIDAFPDFMCPAFFRKESTIGMLPIISMTAKRIIVAVNISLKLKFMLLRI